MKRTTAAGEAIAGLGLLGCATYVGLVFVHRPALNGLDRFAFRQLPSSGVHHPLLLRMLLLTGSPAVVVIAVGCAFAIGCLSDLRRAIACVMGSGLAIVITQNIGKPLVAANVAGFGGHSYPSGSVTAVAAYVAALILVAPRSFRPTMISGGVAIVSAVSGAVIAARWHFATDALGGALVGVGTLLFFDGLLHLLKIRHLAMIRTPSESEPEIAG